MPHRIHPLSEYRFKKTDKLFLDTNAWLLTYAESDIHDTRVDIYKDAFERMDAAQSQIYIDPIVLSEFVYARVKLAGRSSQSKFPRPKDFRGSPAFPKAAVRIANDIEKILARCHYLERGITPQAIQAILPAYTEGKMDFNDYLIAQLCAANGYIFVTNDGDFVHQNMDFTIITDNAQLLKASK